MSLSLRSCFGLLGLHLPIPMEEAPLTEAKALVRQACSMSVMVDSDSEVEGKECQHHPPSSHQACGWHLPAMHSSDPEHITLGDFDLFDEQAPAPGSAFWGLQQR